jgi:spore germination cell wall hydrolase CwlJ-like protein
MMKEVKTAYRRADIALLGAFILATAGATPAFTIGLHTDKSPEPPAAVIETVMVTQSPVVAAEKQFQAQAATEARCLADAMYYEARGEGVKGEKAVAEVVLQRTRDRFYPTTICGVVHEGVRAHRRSGCQFTFACDGSMRRPKDLETWEEARELAERIMAGKVKLGNMTGRAIAYHSVAVDPFWADYMIKTAQIGNHVFYRRDPMARAKMAQALADAEAAAASQTNEQPAQGDTGWQAQGVSTLREAISSQEIQSDVEVPSAVSDGA